MLNSRNFLLAALLAVAPVLLSAQTQAPPASSTGKTQDAESVARMARAVSKEILSLPEFGLFDDVRFSIKDYAVTLYGSASRPIVKSSVENVVKRVEGVESVINQIEVLPSGSSDDAIRTRTYIAIYYNPSLSRYNPNRGMPLGPSISRSAFGLTNDPPIGRHPIHIIVKNGNVTLTGVVDNEGDRAIAGIQANSVPGAFAVKNDLQISSDAKPKKIKPPKKK